MPLKNINKKFQLSTQHAMTPESSVRKKTCRSPFHALKFKRRSEPVAPDAFCCDTPTIENGFKRAQVFVGAKNLLNDVCGMKPYEQF